MELAAFLMTTADGYHQGAGGNWVSANSSNSGLLTSQKSNAGSMLVASFESGNIMLTCRLPGVRPHAEDALGETV